MKFLTFLRGWIGLRITGADPGATLEKIRREGITLENIRWEDALTVSFHCSRESRDDIGRICRKQGDEMRCFEETGMIPTIKYVLTRPVLTAVFFDPVYTDFISSDQSPLYLR